MSEVNQEYLCVEQIVELPFKESAGLYLGKFLTKIRDEGKIIANKCPKCKRIVVPPRVACGFCKVKIEDRPENWVELSDRGTVVDCMTIEDREIDAVTGEFVGVLNPNLFIRLDGGDEWTIIAHISEEMDATKVQPGTRVQAVWKPREKRVGKLSDIIGFRVLEERTEDYRAKTNPQIKEMQPLIHPSTRRWKYWHHAGSVRSRFLVELRNNKKIMGTRCPQCNRVYVPARSTCLICFSQLDEWVEVNDRGIVMTYTIVYQEEPPYPLPSPFAYGIIKLDGSDTGLVHILGEIEPENIKIGMQVKAVFKEKREGSILDIKYFRPLT